MSEKNEKLTKAVKEIKLSEEQLESISGGKKHDESHEYDGHPHLKAYGQIMACFADVTQSVFENSIKIAKAKQEGHCSNYYAYDCITPHTNNCFYCTYLKRYEN
ncbi:hypothetical protein [Clostridium thailandense]|uniref:hypothetical protein n=1 Tax=Clostridium thailandense TaxID=2794346 RepID=UPI003989F4FA